MTKLGFIMGYFFLCDRANFFMKENKHFTHINFFLPVAYVAALGLFFHDSTEKTRVSPPDPVTHGPGSMARWSWGDATLPLSLPRCCIGIRRTNGKDGCKCAS